MRALALMLLLACSAPSARAQVLDRFTDGDFTQNPAWTGDNARWRVTPRGGDNVLGTDGLAEADTIILATPSAVTFGTWRVRFSFEGVNLSTSNGARIYLVSDRAELRGAVRGYFLQIGTNTTEDVRLFRQDGDAGVTANRVLLGASGGDFDVGDVGDYRFEVTRDAAGRWTVRSNGADLFTATDATYTAGTHAGVWVKHIASTRQGYFFDDVEITGQAGPPDATAPRVDSLRYAPAEPAVRVYFSEPVRANDGVPAFTLAPARPFTVGPITPGTTTPGFVLRLTAPLAPGAYTLAIGNVRDVTGNVLRDTTVAFSVLAPGDVPAARDVVVNEIHAAPPTGQPEFFEVFNRSAKAFDLRDFRFSDNAGGARVITTQPTPLAPGAYAVVTQNAATFAAAFPGVQAVQPPVWATLNNDGDAVVLRYGALVVDSVAYAASQVVAGKSIERRDPDGPSTARANFAASTDPRGATPGARNSTFFVDAVAPALRSAEQADANAVLVSFDEPLDPASVTPAAFALGGTRPTSAALEGDGSVVRLTFAGGVPAGTLTITGVRDLRGNAAPPITTALATLAAAGDLVVNEILYAPIADANDNRPNQPEYVELFNRSDRTLALRGLTFVGDPNENGVRDTLRLGLDGRAVPPGGFVVVYDADASDGDPATASRLALAFPEVDFTSANVVLAPVATVTSGGLVASGERIRVVQRGLTIDSVFYDPDWHTAGLREAPGTALERIRPDGLSDDPTNWGSSPAASGGTPGARNALTLDPADPSIPTRAGLRVEPSPFSPDGDGLDDATFLVYRLRSETATVRARVYDAAGRLVRTLTGAALAGATGQIAWDGLDDDGRTLPIGIYVALLDAVDERAGRTETYRAALTLARRLD